MIELVIQFSLEIHHIEEAKWVTNFTVTLKEMTNVKQKYKLSLSIYIEREILMVNITCF